jgi:hypothetical protein
MDHDGGACDPTGTRMMKSLAMDMANGLADDVCTHERYIGIVKTYDAYMAWAGPKGRKRAVAEAAKFWKVGGRTVGYALAFRDTAPSMDWAAYQKWRTRPASSAVSATK